MNIFFKDIKPYSQDLNLFHKLGFDIFNINDHEEHLVGEYKFPTDEPSKVKVFVTCMPAQFWRFEILNHSGEQINISTGSGLLTDYWNSVEKFATGLINVDKISM